VLKYVQNKDVFMRYHKAHLTRRLILDSSADNEKEENMVEWLRVSITEFNAVIKSIFSGILLVRHAAATAVAAAVADDATVIIISLV